MKTKENHACHENEKKNSTLENNDSNNSKFVEEEVRCSETIKCLQCDASFTRKSYLNRHLRRHTGEKPFKCEYCELCFRERSYLKIHTMTHTGEKPYQCQYCEKMFYL